MTSPPLVLEIKENSLDEGPGIRSVVFFKGCPLGCAWCHNPESRRRCVELSYDAAECLSTCDGCMRACPQDAITRERPSFLDRERCDLCLACVRVCPSEALTQVVTEMDVRDIVRRVLRDKAFYDTSGGGVTLSGGRAAASVAVGETVVITVVVTNLGPQAATGVALTGFQEITLFENLTMSTTQGRCPTLFALGQPVGCALGTLAPGASATVTIAATAASQLFAGAIGSSVTVTVGGTLTANEVDPQPGNNAVSAALVVVWPPDVAPSNGRFTTAASSVPVGLAVVGDTLNFRVTVSNAGGPTSGPVTVSTALAGMVPVNLPPSCSAAAPSVVSCTIAALAPGASTEVGFWLTIGADAVSGPLPTPVPATTTVSTPGELRTTDNTTQTVLTIVNRPNLRVRTASFTDRSHRPIAFARVGDVVIFEVEIENVGQVASSGVDVVLRMDYGLVDRGGFCPAPTAAGPTAQVCDTSYIGAGQSTRVSGGFRHEWRLDNLQLFGDPALVWIKIPNEQIAEMFDRFLGLLDDRLDRLFALPLDPESADILNHGANGFQLLVVDMLLCRRHTTEARDKLIARRLEFSRLCVINEGGETLAVCGQGQGRARYGLHALEFKAAVERCLVSEVGILALAAQQ